MLVLVHHFYRLKGKTKYSKADRQAYHEKKKKEAKKKANQNEKAAVTKKRKL